MIFTQSYNDLNLISLTFTLPLGRATNKNKSSIYLILGIMQHKGQNSLYSVLKKLNLIT